jgi:hypothetical protein
VCPPPVPRKTPTEVKQAKYDKTLGSPSGDIDRIQDMKGVMYYEYDLMFHYLLASLRRADGLNGVTSTGVKTFNIFAGLGEHRCFIVPAHSGAAG